MKHKKKISLLLTSVLVTSSMLMPFTSKTYANDNNKLINNNKLIGINMIKEGYLKIDKHGKTIITQKYIDHVKKNLDSSKYSLIVQNNTLTIVEKNNLRSSSGVTKITWDGIKFKLYLSSEIVNLIIGGVSGATALNSLITAYFPNPYTATVAAIAGIITSALTMLNYKSTGVVISGLYQPHIITLPIIIYWISPQ